MPKEIDVAQRLMVKGARQMLIATSPNVEDKLTEIKRSPEILSARTNELENAVKALSNLVFSEQQPWIEEPGYNDMYFNAHLLWVRREKLAKHGIPTFTDIIKSKNKEALATATDTFRDMARFTHQGEWRFPNEVTNTERLISAFLIEGYALFMEKLYGDPRDLPARRFVLAIEEILWNKFQGSKLLADVLPWMIEEREELSYRVKNDLAKLTPEYKLAEKRASVLGDAPLLRVIADDILMSSPFGKYAIAEAIRPLKEDLRRKFGDKWEAVLIGQLKTVSMLNLLQKPAESSTHPGQAVATLFLLGYEIANEDKLSLFTGEIFELIKDYIDPESVKKYGAEIVSRIVVSIIAAGISIRNFVDPSSKVSFDPSVEGATSLPVPEAFKKFFEEMGR